MFSKSEIDIIIYRPRNTVSNIEHGPGGPNKTKPMTNGAEDRWLVTKELTL